MLPTMNAPSENLIHRRLPVAGLTRASYEPTLPAWTADNVHIDLALWSSDGLKFSVSRLNLLVLSPVLRDMAIRIVRGRGSHLSGGVHVVDLVLPEDRHTLADLLLCCYPLEPPRLKTAAHTFGVYKAAVAYQLNCAQRYCLGRLQQLAEVEPLTVYTIGVAEKLEDLALRAARASLSLSLVDLLEHRNEIYQRCTIRQLQSLYEYRIKCQEAASIVARAPPQPCSFILWNLWTTPDCSRLRGDDCLRFGLPNTNVRACCTRPWWQLYLDGMVRLMRDMHVSGRSLASEQVVCAQSVQVANQCEVCKELGIPKALEDYHQLFTQIVNNRIAQVT